jgi:hypothetical protein
VAGAVENAHFTEVFRAVVRGPYDLSLVEGSITTPHDVTRIQQAHRASRYLVTIGACATAGGIQALRNFKVRAPCTSGSELSASWTCNCRSLNHRAFLRRSCAAVPTARHLTLRRASVDGPLRDLRRLLYCGEWLESHTLHVYMLHAPDFLGYADIIQMVRDIPDVVQRGFYS